MVMCLPTTKLMPEVTTSVGLIDEPALNLEIISAYPKHMVYKERSGAVA